MRDEVEKEEELNHSPSLVSISSTSSAIKKGLDVSRLSGLLKGTIQEGWTVMG